MQSETALTAGLLTMPALIDCHVHFREPGLEHKATMLTEALAARAGGVKTVCEMPNTTPPTNSVAALADKVGRARRVFEETGVTIKFFYSVTEKSHLDELLMLMNEADEESLRLKSHCPGIKLFLENSTGNLKTPDALVEEVFRAAADIGMPVVAHCEDAQTNARTSVGSFSRVADHSRMRTVESEGIAVERAIDLAGRCGTRLHIAHVSTRQAIERIEQGKKSGVHVTCEVTPHHLFLSVDDYATLGTLCKMNPPVRDIEHCEALWDAIERGIVNCISTDHAPHTLSEKMTKQELAAPSGVPGVETMLPLLLTVAAGEWPHPRTARIPSRFSYQDIVRLCFEEPNEIFSLHASPAPAIAIDPALRWTLRGVELHSKCGWTPYEGWNVVGKLVSITPPPETV